MTDTPKFSTEYNDLKEHLKVLSVDDLQNIQTRAKILSFEECLTWLGYKADEVPELELDWAERAHARGALEAVHDAAKHLFSNMKTRNGAQAALEYLKAKSADFQMEIVPSAGGKGFSFSANMHPDPHNKDKKSPKLEAVG